MPDPALCLGAGLTYHGAMTPPDLPIREFPHWQGRFPWLFAGITGTAPLGTRRSTRLDMALTRDPGSHLIIDRWGNVLGAAGFVGAVLARQVHESRIAVHLDPVQGIHIETDPADGHLTRQPGVLLAVTVADCVPVYLVDPDHHAIALLHAGWRGVAAGILAQGVELLRTQVAAVPGRLHLHLGPAICGRCYEVGPEVFAALGESVPVSPTPVDVRAVLVRQAAALGLTSENISVSEQCTLCGEGEFFSHRRGDPERQVALLGIRG